MGAPLVAEEQGTQSRTGAEKEQDPAFDTDKITRGELTRSPSEEEAPLECSNTIPWPDPTHQVEHAPYDRRDHALEEGLGKLNLTTIYRYALTTHQVVADAQTELLITTRGQNTEEKEEQRTAAEQRNQQRHEDRHLHEQTSNSGCRAATPNPKPYTPNPTP